MPKPKTDAGAKYGFRSGLEADTAADLKSKGIEVRYEERKFTYIKPQKNATYTPDYILPNGIVIETKGRFVVADRLKHLLLQAQHPDLDIRFVFSRSSTRISKTSKTTYAAWCEKNNFLFADKRIPQAWLDEPVCKKRLSAIEKATK